MAKQEPRPEQPSKKTAQLLRQNHAAQLTIQRQIEALALRFNGSGAHSQPRSRRLRPVSAPAKKAAPVVEIKVAKTPEAIWSAKGIAEACNKCGFPAAISQKETPLEEGIHVESHSDTASTALLIQGAFRIAGIHAALIVHSSIRPGVVAVHVGATGLG